MSGSIYLRLKAPASEDWPEDFNHENGSYINECCLCGHRFLGHKRRVVCRICATPPQPTPTP